MLNHIQLNTTSGNRAVRVTFAAGTPRVHTTAGWIRSLTIAATTPLLCLLMCGAATPQQPSPGGSAGETFDATRIYNLTNIWTLHLTFAPDQWNAMEPKGGGNFFGGGPRESMRGSRTLAPVVMSQADSNRDARITPDEFTGLATRWFKAWDASGSGQLNEGQLRAGLNKIRNPAGEGVAAMLLAEEGGRNGIAVALGIEFVQVHADLEFEGRVLKDVAVRYKGNGSFMESRNSLKRSLKIDLNKYAKEQSLGGVTTLTLQNNVTDATLMNEVLAYRLYRDANVPAPRTAYARVFVTVPGKHDRKYLGLYSMTEAVDRDFAERNFGTRQGAIFKPVMPSLFTDLGADWAAYNQVYDPKSTPEDAHKKAVMEVSRFLTQSDDATFASRIGEFIDLPEFARFMAVMVYLSDLDGILGVGQNLFLHWHPKSQRFQFIPWDQDHSWGQFARATQEQRDKLSLQHPWQGENFFLERMYKVEAFQKLYRASLDEFARTIFAPERIAQQVDQIAAIIRPAVQEESESKLGRFDKLVAGELVSAPGPFGGGQIKPIKPFAKVRTQSVIDQQTGKSQGLVVGGGFPGGFGGGGGLGTMFSRPLLKSLDTDQNGTVTQTEFTDGFKRLFQAWDTGKTGSLTFALLRAGIEKDLPPTAAGGFPFGGRPGGPDRGNPPGPGSAPNRPNQRPDGPPPEERR